MPEEEETTETEEQEQEEKGKKSFSDSELRSIMANEKRQGKRAGIRELGKKLGIEAEDPDEIERQVSQIIEARNEQENKDKSETQKAKDEAAKDRDAAKRDREAAKKDRFEAKAERLLVTEGATAATRSVALLGLEYTDDPDEETILGAIAELKKDLPALFDAKEGESSDENGSGTDRTKNPDSDPGKGRKNQGTGKQPTALERLAQRHPDAMKRKEASSS